MHTLTILALEFGGGHTVKKDRMGALTCVAGFLHGAGHMDYENVRNDFEASLTFLPSTTGDFPRFIAQGYRGDFAYKDEMNHNYMIWPVFVDAQGRPLAHLAPVPTENAVTARMVILDPELRVTEHRKRIKEGLQLYVREGWTIVAEGVVTRVVDLFAD